MTQISHPGIYPDFPIDAYFADPCPAPSLTQSIAKILLDRSPAHAKRVHPRLMEDGVAREDDYRADRVIGDAAHSLLIGRGKDLAEAPFDDWRKKEAQSFREMARAEGKLPILSKHLDRARAVEKATRAQLANIPGCESTFSHGQGEVVIAWEEGGLWCRSLIDWMESPTSLWDLKTTGGSVAPHIIASKMVEDGWAIQAAMQERGLNLLDPSTAGRRVFRFVAIENEEPYALVVVHLSEHWLTMGRKQLDMAMTAWRHSIETGQWPGYPRAIITPDYPGWHEARWLDREVIESERAPSAAPIRSAEFIMAG